MRTSAVINGQVVEEYNSAMGGLIEPQPARQDESGRIWTFVGLGVAIVLIVVAVLAIIGRSGRATPKQPPAYASKLQLTDLKMTPSTVGSAFYVEGMLYNNGNSDITGVQVQAQFHGANGQVLETQTHPMEGMVGNSAIETQNLTQAPIKPNQSRPVRVYFDHYPAGWNKQMPDLKVTTVAAHAP
ncbi:MAG TPA: DUF2393 family protein [Terriglobales bacterium]|nr:DUF2393 family protein [Terriglobales bacterium]